MWLSLLNIICVLFCATFAEEDNKDDKVCFRVLGCFSVGEPWKTLLRPIPAPMSPEEINTRIYFYSRADPKKKYEISIRPSVLLNGAPFDTSKPTVIITHGFSSNGSASWIQDMKDAYLKQVDGNVFVTDWGPGASIFNYLQVAGNTRVVGAELKRLIQELKIDPGKLHLVGHSLGSHISAYAAKNITKVARITALDPAQPGFEGFSSAVRLHEDDAEFIDVIHTDARPFIPTLGFGMMTPVGHVDFYPNGGFDQPGCIVPDLSKLSEIKSLGDLIKYPVEVIGEMVACPHGRAQEYFTESLTNTDKCIFWGHKTTIPTVVRTVANTVTQGVFKKLIALSSTCSRQDCTPMGFRTKLSPLRGSFVVTTHGKPPYCISEPGVPPETPPTNSSSSSPFAGRFFKKPLKAIGSAIESITSKGNLTEN